MLHKISKHKIDAQAQSRLLCFHHVGGDKHSFRMIGSNCKSIEVWAVFYPGRSLPDISSLLSTVDEIAEQVYHNIQLVGADCWNLIPTHCFGHSLGGIVAFEVCRRLQQRTSIKIHSLILSSIRSPLDLTAMNKLMAESNECHHLKNDASLVQHIISINGIPPELTPEFVTMKLQTIRGDFKAFESYQFDQSILPSRLDCRISTFCGSKDPMLTPADMESWSIHSNSSSSHAVFNGSHFYFAESEGMKSAFLSAVLAALSTAPGTFK